MLRGGINSTSEILLCRNQRVCRQFIGPAVARRIMSCSSTGQVTSRGGELIALAGPRNPYPGKLGFIEEGDYADMLLLDGNQLENIELVGHPETNFVPIMKTGTICKNTIR